MFSRRVIRMSITLAVIIGIALPAMVQQVPAAEGKPKTQERKSGKQGTPSQRKVRKKGAEKLGRKGVEVRIGPKIEPFRTLGAAFTDLLKYRLQGGNLEGVTITPNKATIAGLELQLRDFHEWMNNHRFVEIPTPIEVLEIEPFLAQFQDQFRIDPQVLYGHSWESIQASMEDIKNLVLSQARGWGPPVWAAAAAVVIADAAAIQAANTLLDRKLSCGAGPEADMRYDLLHQYQIIYRYRDRTYKSKTAKEVIR